jgi:hypothetical protein
MAAAFAFLGMLLLSLVIAMLAALQLGDFFQATDEFALVAGVVAGFAVVAMAAFAASYALVSRARALNGAAWLLAAAAAALPSVPGLVDWIASHATNSHTVGIENTYIRIEVMVPALIVVLVQWGLIRRRWLRTAGEDDFSLWPWATTVVAGLVILNPVGLALVSSAFKRSAADLLWELFAWMAAATSAALVVMAVVECYIRKRVLRRRLAGSRS